MYKSTIRNAALLLAIAATSAVTAPVFASAFWPGTVSGVPSGQSLTIRKFASPIAPQVGTASNGDDLSLTGRCRRLKPNGSTLNNFRIDVPGTVAWRTAKMSQPRTWCQIWFEVSPSNYKAVWARGSFITPG